MRPHPGGIFISRCSKSATPAGCSAGALVGAGLALTLGHPTFVIRPRRWVYTAFLDKPPAIGGRSATQTKPAHFDAHRHLLMRLMRSTGPGRRTTSGCTPARHDSRFWYALPPILPPEGFRGRALAITRPGRCLSGWKVGTERGFSGDLFAHRPGAREAPGSLGREFRQTQVSAEMDDCYSRG